MNLETNSKNKSLRNLYRGISDFKKGYQPRNNIVKDEKGVLVTDSHSILTRWRNHLSQLFNVRGVNDVWQTEIHTREPLVPGLSEFEYEMGIENLKRHKLPGIDEIPAELIKTGKRTICCQSHKPTHNIWNKEELPEEWTESIIVPTYKKGDKTDCGNYRSISLFANYIQNLSNY